MYSLRFSTALPSTARDLSSEISVIACETESGRGMISGWAVMPTFFVSIWIMPLASYTGVARMA